MASIFSEKDKDQVNTPVPVGHSGRLWVVSNRLPVTVSEKGRRVRYFPSSGGVSTGLASYFARKDSRSYVWMGWAGGKVSDERKAIVAKELNDNHNCVPVFLGKEKMDKFYLGFCNKTIWPLFHYFPTYTEYVEENWENYKEVNGLFRDELLRHLQPDDILWIHDYHLMLLPGMLKEKMPSARIGFFLHIPFPSSEMTRLLPGEWREEILEGLLGSDLIGFHTERYARHFLNSVSGILGIKHTDGKIIHGKKSTTVQAFPMGVDYEHFHKLSLADEVNRQLKEIKDRNRDQKIILSIDRLDYTKGIYHRLMGYEKFLSDNPEWRQKVVLMIIIVPSRIGVDSYRDMKKKLDEEIGRINGRFSDLNWSPIAYQYKSIRPETLVALYKAADIALVTPLRDGMNLVAKEYLASHPDHDGILILSEMAGAANELTGAIMVNPNYPKEITSAIEEALVMPQEEQIRRNAHQYQRVKEYSVFKWADSFLGKLTEENDSSENTTSSQNT